MSNTLQLLKKFCDFIFSKQDVTQAVSLLTKDICWLGNVAGEDVHSLEQAHTYLSGSYGTIKGPYAIQITGEEFVPLGETCGTAVLRMCLASEDLCTAVSATASSKQEQGVEKLCTLQFAVIDAVMKPGQNYLVTKNKAKIAKEKRELVLSTMPGGLMGGYIQPGFPFYFIDERMLNYLGYTDEAEFVADIDGLISNVMHPDDRAFVDSEVARQFCVSDQYAVDYRMRKKDGNYIWIHDIGKKTIAENGRNVIISVCYDITAEHKKQVQLDNMIKALPGGAALYKWKPGKLELLYQSGKLSAMAGYTPEEYQDLMQANSHDSIYAQDLGRVLSALAEVAASDRTVTIDYRVPHKNGGYVWITGSFKSAGSEDGYPIIHAVFTEMAQMRELINDIVENAGIAMIVTDYQTRELLYLNQATLSALGKSDKEYEGKICYEYLLGRATPCPFCKQLDVGTSTEQRAETYIPELGRCYMTQGRLVNWGGRTAHIEYMTDITENKKAQEQLAETVNNISCGVVVSRRKNGKSEILYLNKGFCKLFEQDEKTLRSHFLKENATAVYEEDLPNLKQMKTAIRSGTPHMEITFRYRCDLNRTKWIRVDVNTVNASDGSLTTYASYYDVTAQKQQEQQLQDVIHTVPGGVCLYRWDGKKLHPIIVSEQFTALLGANARSAMERARGTDYQHVHPEDLPGLQQAIIRAFTQTGKIEYTCRSLNDQTNEYLWIFMQGVAVPQPDGTQLAYVSYTNVTKEHGIAQQLRASERALDFATEQAGIWYWKYDPALDRAYFSERCMRDFDVPAVMENFPKSWLDTGAVLAQYIDGYRAAAEKIKNGQAQVKFEAQMRNARGELHWAELRFSNQPDTSGKPGLVVCTARIIDYEKALAVKYEMEKKKPTLGDKALLFHAIFNLSSGKTKDYGYVDGEACLAGDYTTFGYTIAHVIEAAVDPDAKREIAKLNQVDYLMSQLRMGNQSFSVDYRRRLPDGRILWVRNVLQLISEPDTQDTLLFEYCYDIHDQRMADELLRVATVYDFERLTSVNFVTGQMMPYGESSGNSPKTLLDYEKARRNYTNRIVAPEEREAFLRATTPQTVMEQVAAKGAYTFTTRIRRENGADGVVKTRFVPYDAENKIYIMSRTDVTDLLREEESQKAALNNALIVAQQANSAKTDFLAAMSHDIRTPMNAIVGMCELAIADEDDRAQVHESLQTIHTSSALLLSLINNILDMSRIESGKMVLSNQPFSLTQEIHDTAKTFRVLAEQKQQTFLLHTNIKHDRCTGDAARIHSALDNILSNAIKYTPACGTITYRVSELPSDKSGIGLYHFEISDTGIGISEEQQTHLFEPFYRGENSLTAAVEGTGLGLSISKAIIELKGGTISVNSNTGSGTTFVVELPLHFADVDSSDSFKGHSLEQIASPDLSHRHILLCEDHPINQKVAAKILEKAGASVTVACDGKAGVEQFVQSPAGTFDLILMDIRMPQMNGYEAAKAIRESSHTQAKSIPIVAMTANAFAEDVQKSMAAGMDAHLAKPIVPMQLYEMVLRFTSDRTQKETSKIKVLFVDDVELNIAVLTAAINEEYEVFVSRNGEDALSTLENNPDIAAVITDIMMPGIDGVTLIKTIRANDRYRRVAILANTQYGDAMQEEKLRTLGADDFLYKPTTPSLVKNRLKDALHRYGRC